MVASCAPPSNLVQNQDDRVLHITGFAARLSCHHGSRGSLGAPFGAGWMDGKSCTFRSELGNIPTKFSEHLSSYIRENDFYGRLEVERLASEKGP
jgi:hypothetical protein